ncbi:MAG: hypothetical protein O2968_17510 [Acidobacteria bacterium]|nr:hypothetical protein [Acidobacteriota bacterium]
MLRRLATLPARQRLLGILLAAWFLSPPAQAQVESSVAGLTPVELASAAAPQPITSSQPRADRPTSGVIADLLSLIKQIEPLRVTVLHLDYHDQALAAQTKHQQMRRRAGIGTPPRANLRASY